MFEESTLERFVKRIKRRSGQFPDIRTGQNIQYEMLDAVMGAFSVFFLHSPSFLAHQADMKRRKGHSNTESLFEIGEIPSDNQIRSLLHPVAPAHLSGVFREVFHGLESSKVLIGMRSHGHNLLIALDGTEYFSSKKIQCQNCSQRELSNGKANYYQAS